MRKHEIDELINIYEEQGIEKLVTKLYQIQQQYKDIELDKLLSAYMHLTNKDNHSYFYTSDNEQIVTNNTGSIIYFNKKIFNFKNINNRKIVTKESFRVSKEEMIAIPQKIFNGNYRQTSKIDFIGEIVTVSSKENSAEFSKQEFELIAKLLNNASFMLSDNSPALYVEGDNGYAYVLGKRYGFTNKF